MYCVSTASIDIRALESLAPPQQYGAYFDSSFHELKQPVWHLCANISGEQANAKLIFNASTAQ